MPQRAYTMRITSRNADADSERELRYRLWQTHELVNRGTQVWGDWLLTLRGGLSVDLVESLDDSKEKKTNDAKLKLEQDHTDRRVLLALSWLTVENKKGFEKSPVARFLKPKSGPARYIVADANDPKRGDQVVKVFKKILSDQGVVDSELQPWLDAATNSLKARIRDDKGKEAIWVNRWQMFRDAHEKIEGLDAETPWDLLQRFFKSQRKYFEGIGADSTGPKELVNEAVNWLTQRYGRGQGAEYERIANEFTVFAELSHRVAEGKIAPTEFADALFKGLACEVEQVGRGRGQKLKNCKVNAAFKLLRSGQPTESLDWRQLTEEANQKSAAANSKVGRKGGKEWADKILSQVEGLINFRYDAADRQRYYEYSVMLDHAARRICQTHSWIKRAEYERRKQHAAVDALKKLEENHSGAVEFLNDLCADRSTDLSASDQYRISKQAIEGWNDVIKRWAEIEKDKEIVPAEKAAEREKSVGELQAESEVKKFDVNLMRLLATDEAKCVWLIGKKVDPSILRTYSEGTQADAKQQHFKVPVYCHPDPFLHPVFCEFGNSRWDISYAAQEARNNGKKLEANVIKARERLAAAQLKLENAKTEHSKQSAGKKIAACAAKLGDAKAALEETSRPGNLTMKLWDSQELQTTKLRWQSNRLKKDLRLGSEAFVVPASDGNEQTPPKGGTTNTPVRVSRDDRASVAAAVSRKLQLEQQKTNRLSQQPRLDKTEFEKIPVEVADLYKREWNGRLQVPRDQLEQLAKYQDDPDKFERLLSRLRWFITMSPDLQPTGPGIAHLENEDCHPPGFERKIGDGKYKGGKYKASLIRKKENEGRGPKCWFELSRIPELRILSVDLGHRVSAACAVWETCSMKQVLEAWRESAPLADKKLSNHNEFANPDKPTEATMYVHLLARSSGNVLIDSHDPDRVRKVIYRRIGPDRIDGKENRAAWAKMVRQFVIRLPGERKNDVRMASEHDRAVAADVEQRIGLNHEYLKRTQRERTGKDWRIDELMRTVLRNLRLGLRRHADYYRLWHELPGTFKTRPGGKVKPVDTNDLLQQIEGCVVRWHELATSQKWIDDFARDLFDQLKNDLDFDTDVDPFDAETGDFQQQRKTINRQLQPLIEKLTKPEFSRLREKYATKFATQWKINDEAWRGKQGILRTVRQWIVPTGIRKRIKAAESGDEKNRLKRAVRGAGGLSLNRLANIRGLYRLQRSYFQRSVPDGDRSKDREITQPGNKFGHRVLQTLERLRENRVKQLCSRIVEAALGIGAEQTIGGRDVKRPNRQLHLPCHAIVIEDLKNYRTDIKQMRAENRRLAVWCAGQLRGYLRDACELNGLWIHEIPAAYTSQQDFRTGLPGRRGRQKQFDLNSFEREFRSEIKQLQKQYKCKEVSDLVAHLQTQVGGDEVFGEREINNAKEARLRWVEKCLMRLAKAPQKESNLYYLSKGGGDLFFPRPADHLEDMSSQISVIDADLNAAANIGLKALTDPDWPGRFWYIPVHANSNKPAPEKFKKKGPVIVDPKQSLPTLSDSGKSKSIVNLWHDLSVTPILKRDNWVATSQYWDKVELEVWKSLLITRQTKLDSKRLASVEK